MSMTQPMGHIKRLAYTTDSQYHQGTPMEVEVLEVTFEAPDGETYTHNLPNGNWQVHNPALQLMALNGWQPTDFDEGFVGTALEPEGVTLVPLTVNEDGEFVLAQNAFQGGAEALKAAEWFDEEAGSDSHEEGAVTPAGGGDSDGGDKGGAQVELSEEEGVGMEVSVE